MKLLIYGIGVNDSNYVTKPTTAGGLRVPCPFYVKWLDMLTRCYSVKLHKRNPSYIGCTVCDDWLVFSKFKLWMETQDWKNKELDKDLLIQDNKIYSPRTCLLISKEINLLLTDRKVVQGPFKKGVGMHKQSGKVRAQCSVNGKQIHIGLYDTEDEAYAAYKEFKSKLIQDVAMTQKEPVKSALLRYKID